MVAIIEDPLPVSRMVGGEGRVIVSVLATA